MHTLRASASQPACKLVLSIPSDRAPRPHDSDADCACPLSRLTGPLPVTTRMRDHLLPPFRSDRALSPHDSDAASKPIIYFPEGSQQVQVPRCTTPNTLDSRPSTRAHSKPLDPGPRPALRRDRPVHPFPYAARLNGPGLARPKPFCCSPQGMKMGFDPPGRL